MEDALLPALLPLLSASHFHRILQVVDTLESVDGIELDPETVGVLNAQHIVSEQHLWESRHVHGLR